MHVQNIRASSSMLHASRDGIEEHDKDKKSFILRISELTKYSLLISSLDKKKTILQTKKEKSQDASILARGMALTDDNKSQTYVDMLRPRGYADSVQNKETYLRASHAKFNVDVARSQIINYNFNSASLISTSTAANISSILENSFMTMSSLISKPVYYITPQKVVIHLFFFFLTTTTLKSKHLELLCANLSNYFKKPVELNLVRLHYPFYDSNILANLLGRISDINFKPYIYILDNIFNKATIKNPTIMIPESKSSVPTFLTGLKIRLAGRLLKQKIIPRRTVKTTQNGSLTRSSADLVTTSRFTTKNKRGTFSLTITIGHRFF